MKIAVVGTSNSIRLEGYFPIYQAIEQPNIVDNLSLGGSNCQLIPYSIEKYKIFDTYDFLITDTAVNDGDYLSVKLRSPHWLYNELYTIMSMIKEAPIRHLHLIFPTNIEYKKHYTIHRQVCQELNIPYIDIEKILSKSSTLGQKDLYFDEKHISYFLSEQLAYVIKQEREKIFSAPKDTDFSACYKAKKYFLYSLPDTFKDQYPVCTKDSSLLSCNYIVLKSNDTLSLDNLPASNLESLCFWTNTKAGYYTLETENHKQNFNLFFGEAHYTYFRPLPQKAFPVHNFLKLKVELDPNYPEPLEEFTSKPVYTDNNELILNSFLFSQSINPPRRWKEKELAENSDTYLSAFQKIYSYCTAVPKYADTIAMQDVPADFVFIAAHIYPKNQLLRKEFFKLFKKSDNPYIAYAYTKLYVLPREKYTPAIKILKHLLTQKLILNAVMDLATCYIKLKQYDEAIHTVNLLPEEKYHGKRMQLLCSIYANMNLPALFFKKAQEFLELNESFSNTLLIVDYCIMMKQYQKAAEFMQTLFTDNRHFTSARNWQFIMDRTQKLQACLEKY